jgi:phosphoribosylaminoimidazole-succinocarboxamide synthase
MASTAVISIDLHGKLPKLASGKVRDLFEVDDNTLLFVASDRISAFDVVMDSVCAKAWQRILIWGLCFPIL